MTLAHQIQETIDAVRTGDMTKLKQQQHHQDCDKRWRSFFGQPIQASECPTCRAIRDDNEIFETVMLERMYAGRGWTYREVGP